MAWRTKCYECGQDAPITRPLYEKQSLLENGDLGLAIATYEAHPRRPTDTRSRSSVSRTVPQYQMRKAHSTTPGADPPQVAPRSSPPRNTKKSELDHATPTQPIAHRILPAHLDCDGPRRVRVGNVGAMVRAVVTGTALSFARTGTSSEAACRS